MAKQKFQCKGVVRKTGQRVAVEVSAESKEAAIKIAAAHGVAVEQIVAASNVAQPPRSAAVPAASSGQDARAPADEDADESVDDLLDSSDDDLDDLDLGDDAAGAPPTPSGQQATKACPYCGEQVLAVAIKCKHCGSYLAEIAPTTAQPVLAPLARTKRSRAKAMRLWSIIGGSAAGVAVIAVVLWSIFHGSPTPTPRPAPAVASQPAPSPPSPPPPSPPPPSPPPVVVKPEPPKHSSEELAFAAKLSTFLDACDDTAKMLEDVPKPDPFTEQCKLVKTRWAEVPPPPNAVKWAEDAAGQSKQLVDYADVISATMAQQSELLKLAGQSADSPAAHAACHEAAEKLRSILAPIRALIPRDCLPKSG
jgi:hypothetical protein